MLRVEGLSMAFEGVVALEAVALEARAGETIALVGPNGSGKTTLFNVVTGIYRPTAGTVRLRGEDVTGMAPAGIVRRGVARTFQNLRLFERMTVFDNVWVAQHTLPAAGGWRGLLSPLARTDRERRVAVWRLLAATDLADRAHELAANLPLPEQRRLELARALARRPDLLLLDEPSGGMTPAETAAMSRLIREQATGGRACIVIEHKMEMLADLCSRMYVLNFGRKIAQGPPREVLAHPEVREAYLGTEVAGRA